MTDDDPRDEEARAVAGPTSEVPQAPVPEVLATQTPPVAIATANPARVYLFSGLISGFVLLFGAAMFFAGWGAHALVTDDGQSVGNAVAAGPVAEQTALAANVSVNVSAGDGPAWGPADAKVTVIEFSDFECPFCARFHDQTLSQLRDAYGDRIRFVYRNFPLTDVHPFAQAAAEAAKCADEQGKFWAYHDLLFQNQAALQPSDLKSYADRLGLDQGRFSDCVVSHKYTDAVKKDASDGEAAGVTGTPTFFINGRRLVGAQPLTAFEQIIDAALK